MQNTQILSESRRKARPVNAAGEIIDIYCENQEGHTNGLGWQNAVILNVKVGGVCSYRNALSVRISVPRATVSVLVLSDSGN
jgi:hypothetical protein